MGARNPVLLHRFLDAYALNSAGLMAAILRLDQEAVMRDSSLLERLVDTFVMAQLRGEIAVSARRPRLYHVRQRDGGHEVDILIELGGGDVIGIEVKAAAAVESTDARHLAWLRDELGDRFLTGVMLHTGPRHFRLGERISAAPISALWRA